MPKTDREPIQPPDVPKILLMAMGIMALATITTVKLIEAYFSTHPISIW